MEKKELRVVFMGTPDFAVASLQALVENNINVVGVITAPDKPSGRGKKLHEPPVKVFAKEKGLRILQPTNLKDQNFQEELKNLEAHLFIVVAFRMLPEAVWSMPPIGTFNLHASLLPKYRGAAPINWAIINGEKETGITTFFLRHEIDTGHIIAQEKEAIFPHDNVGTLHDRLMEKGAALVTKTVELILTEDYKLIKQEDLIAANAAIPGAPKIFKEDCKINWNQDGEKIRDFIRGLSPYPCSWSNIENAENNTKYSVKIFDVDFLTNEINAPVGTVETDNKKYLQVRATNGWIKIKDLQLQGKKRMPVGDFLRGFDISNYKINL